MNIPQEHSQLDHIGSSKVGPVLVAVLLVLLIIGGATFAYMRRTQTPTVASNAPAVVTTTPPAVTDPVLGASANVTATIADLDKQLAQIDTDLKTTDDTSPTL